MRAAGLLLVALAATVVLMSTAAGQAASTSTLRTISVREDRFRNFDFTSKADNASNVDWPIDFVYLGNASVSQVKSAMQGFFPWPGGPNPMYAHISDNGSTWSWPSDKGFKNAAICVGDAFHQRVYAPGQNRGYNLSWNYYVVATSHIDHNEKCGGWSGKSETAEQIFFAFASYIWPDRVWRNALNMQNSDFRGNIGGHWWQNNGFATEVLIG